MKKSNIKYIIMALCAVIIIILSFMVYNTLFSSNKSNRLSDIKNHKLTSQEKKDIESSFSDLENVGSTKVYVNSKIIKVLVRLNDDIEFDSIKNAANESLSKISEGNLEYYDVEIFIESKNEESEIYPKIGYKHKTSNEFVW